MKLVINKTEHAIVLETKSLNLDNIFIDVPYTIGNDYKGYTPAHYTFRKKCKNENHYSLIFPFDINENGKLLSVTLKDEQRECIIFDTFENMLKEHNARITRKNRNYEYISQDDDYLDYLESF